MEPWETNHEAAHAYGVERLNEAIEAVRQASGWIGILPETSDHVTAMLLAVRNQLDSVLNQVDRHTGLEDFDDEVDARDRAEDLDDPHASSVLLDRTGSLLGKDDEPAEPKVYRINQRGDMG